MKQPQSFKSTFICKYNCTINGLELDIILEDKLHGLGHPLSWQGGPSFVEQETHPSEDPLRLIAGGWNEEVLPRQSPKS